MSRMVIPPHLREGGLSEALGADSWTGPAPVPDRHHERVPASCRATTLMPWRNVTSWFGRASQAAVKAARAAAWFDSDPICSITWFPPASQTSMA